MRREPLENEIVVTTPRIDATGRRLFPDNAVYLKPGDRGYDEALAEEEAFSRGESVEDTKN